MTAVHHGVRNHAQIMGPHPLAHGQSKIGITTEGLGLTPELYGGAQRNESNGALWALGFRPERSRRVAESTPEASAARTIDLTH